MIRADLHIHSEYSSDGEFRVADIVGKCAAGGVDLFSLTDHNTVLNTLETIFIISTIIITYT